MNWTAMSFSNDTCRQCCLFSALAVGIAFSSGCKQAEPAPEPVKPSAAADESGTRDESALMRSFINESKDAGAAPSGALPSGHPPVPGMSAPVAGGSELPEGHPPLPSGMRLAGAEKPTGPPPDLSDLPIAFKVPASWTAEAPTSSMRKAQYRLPHVDGDAADGEMILYFFGANQGGDVPSNIARWVGQFTTLEDEPIPDSGRVVNTMEVDGMKITTLDVAGKYSNTGMGAVTPSEGPQRMLAAIVETPGGRWFFKGTGPLDTMEKHRPAFDEMMSTLKWKSDKGDSGA